MLNIFFGEDFNKAWISPDEEFEGVFEKEWLENPLVRSFVEDIDKVKVLSPLCIDSPILGQIPPTLLSGGSKGLMMLMYVDEYYPDLMIFGNNCSKWLGEVSKTRDMHAICSTYDLDYIGTPCLCVNDNTLITNEREWNEKLRLIQDNKIDLIL